MPLFGEAVICSTNESSAVLCGDKGVRLLPWESKRDDRIIAIIIGIQQRQNSRYYNLILIIVLVFFPNLRWLKMLRSWDSTSVILWCPNDVFFRSALQSLKVGISRKNGHLLCSNKISFLMWLSWGICTTYRSDDASKSHN